MKSFRRMFALGLCLVMIFGLAGGLWAADMPQKININTASNAQLCTLKGIGPALAQRIIEYREKSGNFKTVEGLLNVKGIGPHKLANIKNQITVSIPASSSDTSGEK